MSEIYIVNIADVEGATPVRPPGMAPSRAVTRFLGRDSGPWVYYTERPAGEEVPLHKHGSDRLEFLIEGEIDWYERGKPARRYAAGTLTYVRAGTVYGYEVLQDAKILIWFEESPGMKYQ